jgi:hypothetical protein
MMFWMEYYTARIKKFLYDINSDFSFCIFNKSAFTTIIKKSQGHIFPKATGLRYRGSYWLNLQRKLLA